MAHQVPLTMSEKPTLELHADAASLELVPVSGSEAPFIEVHGPHSEDAVTVTTEGELTRVSLRSPWVVGFDFVGARRLVLHVPQQVRAKISSDAGRVHVERLAGCDLQLSTHAGTVSLDDVHGRIAVSVDSGTVKGRKLGGSFDVRSSAGAVRLGIDALDAGTHHIRTAMGSVKVELAPGLTVRIETATTLGSARSKYPSTPDAPAVLRLEAELGSVRVVEGDAVQDERHGDWPDWRRTWRDVAEAVASFTTRPFDDAMPPPPPPKKPAPRDEIRRVLELVQEGKLSPEDGERLISAMR